MYAFVFRRIMDFDQIMPIVVAMADAGHQVRIGVMGEELDIADEARLSLLPSRIHVWRLRGPFIGVRCAAFLRGIKALVMDWAQREHHCTATLTDIAHRQGIPSISLPHGIDHVADRTYYTERLNAGTFAHFDHIVVPNDIRRDILTKAGMPGERIHMLGAARFTTAWLGRLATIFPPRPDDGSGRLKVVFFEQKIPLRFKATLATLQMIVALDCIDLIIQPKPIQCGRKNDLLEEFPTQISTRHASSLCAWADVIVGTSSTVMFEALVRKKHLVWTRHLDTHDLCYRTHGGAWIVDEDDALIDLLYRLHGAPTTPPVDGTAFCREILWGGHTEDQVATAYRRLLETACISSRAA
jgi:hypothetical protein